MNIKMTKDQFHELIMLYIIDLSKQIKGMDEETTIHSENFDQFLRHIQSKPLGRLKMVYYREDAVQKLMFNKLIRSLEVKDEVRIMT